MQNTIELYTHDKKNVLYNFDLKGSKINWEVYTPKP